MDKPFLPTGPAAQDTLLLFIDYDLTLFDTQRFGDDLLNDIAVRAALPFERTKSDAKRFEADPVLGGYDFGAHIASNPFQFSPSGLKLLQDWPKFVRGEEM